MAKREHPILEVVLTKEMKDTSKNPDKPFYAKVAEYKKVYLFGILLKRISSTGDFPESKI